MIAIMTDLLSHKNSLISGKALVYIGGILNSEDPQIPAKFEFNGGIDKLTNILYDADFIRVKQACWAISNFNASGNNFSE